MNWANILGGGDVIDKGFDLIDNAFHTDQEKAGEKIKLLDSMRPFKLAQRLLAKEIFYMFRTLFYIELALGIIGIWIPQCWEIVAVLNELDVIQMLGYSFLAVVSLYFTGGVVDSFKGKK